MIATGALVPASTPIPLPAPLPAEEPWSPAIIARAQRGDHAAFAVIVRRYEQPIYHFLWSKTRDANEAADMTQDTFVKAYRNLPLTSEDIRIESKFRNWLYTLAINRFRDEARHRKLVKWEPWGAFISVFHPSQVAEEQPDRDAERHEMHEDVRAIIDLMSDKYRVVLVLREYEGLTYDEIAERLNTTRPAIKSLLFRARGQFADLWQDREQRRRREYREYQP